MVKSSGLRLDITERYRISEKMDYKRKLTCHRFKQSSIEGRTFNDEMESDRGRAINSAAVRRLQQKTQVFPLETNAAVRSRLTHSLEVQQVGRYIAKLVLKRFDETSVASELGLHDKREGFVSAVEIACLLHDVGNPPFGHFGEEAINHWLNKTLKIIFEERFGDEVKDDKLFKDLMTFEGNAQAIRLLHSLQSLNLSFTQIACLIKYTRPSYEPKANEGSPFEYRKKKPGYYFSERDFIEQLKKALCIKDGCRFPLTYIMEAADDISYCIADLDDALDKGVLDVEQLHVAIKEKWDGFLGKEFINDKVVKDEYLPKLANDAYARYQSESHNKNHAYILTLRTKLVNDLATYASKRYVEHHKAIFDGEFDEPLLGGSDEYFLASETLKEVAISKVFSNKEVERLELKGHSVISGLLNIYTPLLELTFEEFKVLSIKNFSKPSPIETRLFHDLPSKHKHTYIQSVQAIFDKEEASVEDRKLELYYRTRLIIDYISGMTDRFAFDEYRDLSASI